MSGFGVRLSWAQVNDIGMRAENEDQVGMARQGAVACFVVADGAGGHAGGAIASRLVADAVLATFRATPVCELGTVRAGVAAASASVARAQLAQPAMSEMSSTVAAIVVDEAAAHAVWAHLGDSRVYLFRANRLHSATVDHSLARQLVDNGYPGYDDLRAHPQRHILLAAVGAENETLPTTGASALRAGDALLLCSDGLWEWIDEMQMEAALDATTGSEDWLVTMCAVATAAAAATVKVRDNFCACALRVHGPGE